VKPVKGTPEPASLRRVWIQQLTLFPGLSEGRWEHEPPSDAAAEVSADASSVRDDRQLDLFADRVVLARALDAAVASGRFEEAAQIRRSIDETFGPEAAGDLVALDRLAGLAWDGPPTTPLALWAELDEQLASQPSLRDRLRAGVFARLLQSHATGELLAARPDCLAESPDCTEPVRHQARRRMKQLHPELHAAFMRHAAHT
jgi:hypothetical protein